MKKRADVFLAHILESMTLIEKYTQEKTKEEFCQNVQLQDSVIRRLEIIGEAVKNLPVEVKDTYPDIPWKRIAGLRDVLIHEYFGVDLKLTWEIIKKDLPDLKERITKINNELPPSEKSL